MQKIQLGMKIRDRISGFTGIANSKVEFLNKCVRWSIAPQELHEGKVVDAIYFDEEQIDVVDDGLLASVKASTKEQTGGGANPSPRANPTR